MLSATIVIEKVTMLEIALRREMRQEETLQGPTTITVAITTTCHMIEEMEEVMIEEETLPMIMKKAIVHKRGQEILGMKVMLLINLSIFLFLHFLVPLLWILGIVGWLIVGPLIISLCIRKFSLI